MSYITGSAIKELRTRKGYTQKELADRLFVSEKTVSKWETGRGYPDIGTLPDLAAALGVSIAELFSGQAVTNLNQAANMKKQLFYVCPLCGNIIQSVGQGVISCCGISLPPCEIEEKDTEHEITLEIMDGEYVVTLSHPMTKTHYISFICYVTGSTSQMCKQYPEQDAIARFTRKGHGFIFAFCSRHGLFRIIV